MNTKRAFTLAEIIIAIAVIGILAAILIIVIPRVVDNANQNSALLDAENSLKMLCTDDPSFANEDMVICVSKAKKDYIFGYISEVSGIFPASKQNYNISEATLDKLLADSAITKLESSQSGYAEKNGINENTVMYLGYRLDTIDEQVAISETELELVPGMEYELVAAALPHGINDIVWSCADTDVVDVTNGKLTAKQTGKTKIKATSGKLTAICNVTVREYTPFDGTMADLKDLLENEDRYTYLKLPNSGVIRTTDQSLFPIVIPHDKIVNLNMDSCILQADIDGGTADIESMFIVNGGKLYIENSEGTITAGSRFCSVIKNTNGGLVSVNAAVKIGSTADTPGFTLICNSDGRMKLNLHGERLSMGQKGIIIKNDSGSHLSLVNSNLRGMNIAERLIYNEGVIDEISDCEMTTLSGIIIENKGTICAISNSKLSVDCTTTSELQYNDYSYAIKNAGEITLIQGGEYTVKSLAEDIEKYVFCIEGNSAILNIADGSFSGDSGEFVCKGGSTPKISGGSFAHSVPKSYLADGCSCTQKDDVFVVVNSK